MWHWEAFSIRMDGIWMITVGCSSLLARSTSLCRIEAGRRSLRCRSAKATMDEKVRRAAEILHLTPLLDRYPRQLSGGQRQRVAMGRAIVRDP
jgi:ABC-type sugar transport system ATPase subunit